MLYSCEAANSRIWFLFQVLDFILLQQHFTVTKATHSPDDKINVVVGNSDNHIRHVVWGVQMAFHGGPEETKWKDRCHEE